MRREGQVRIGTSGWSYKHWKGIVYPLDLPPRQWLTHYTGLFDTVELNNSFYHLPSEATFRGWARQAPPGFLFAVKASRYLTHLKKLRDPEDGLKPVIDHARRLGEHLGPILYQLPPWFHVDVGRLRRFLSLLPVDLTHAVEFRDSSWYVDEVREALAEYGAALCIHDLRGVLTPQWVTGRSVYVRFHGPTARAYAGRYSTEQLGTWAIRMEEWRQAGHDVYAYFNNDNAGHAVTNARELRTLRGNSVSRSPDRRTQGVATRETERAEREGFEPSNGFPR
jgi:uncharacterized protein YecE (DUF72 family)